ncbi:MAG TPA: putative quinol monooxygenase [Nevskiaceae bacterium]|nr:putative quinol monooxygenase [Nevskiaceae bacterium]
MSIRVVARLVVQPQHVAAFKEGAVAVIAPTRKEPGCRSYTLLQNNADPTDFTFVEEWDSPDALSAHMKTPHIAGFLGTCGPMLAGAPDIRQYTLVA